MRNMITTVLFSVLLCPSWTQSAEPPANTFVEIAKDDIGGHYFSQMIYAPSIKGIVSWGTRTHSKKIRAHETQHFDLKTNQWLNAWPKDRAESWSKAIKQWPDWSICATVGEFYTRDGIEMPRPNSSFYQACWDDHNQRIVYYVGSMTFSYHPKLREWKLIHAPDEKAQPPALLLWGSLCYDPINKQILLFGGGGVDAPDGRPHTWVLDVKTDKWRRLKLKMEPPARCNSRMVYDSKNKVVVLFGGDGQDRGLADTWLFDVTTQRWQERKPPKSPFPRSCHAMAYLEKSGIVLLVGGLAVAPYQKVRQLSEQAWVYDVAKNQWTPLTAKVPRWRWASMENIPKTDEVILATASPSDHSRVTYRFRYDSSMKPANYLGVPPDTIAYKTTRTKEWYKSQPPGNRKEHHNTIANLPVNKWVEMKPPKSTQGRTWGTSLFDVDRAIAMKWGGGHSGYQGTDMAFYDVSANRFMIDRTPAFTPEPFGRWARRPAGRTFFNQPWARHMRHTCAYDSVAKLGIFTDAGGSRWYERDKKTSVKHTWLYDPEKRHWLEPIPQPFRGGLSISPIAVPTPKGVIVYHRGEMYRYHRGWEKIHIQGQARPPQHEYMTMVYDDKRDRLILLSEIKKERTPQLWFFDVKERQWQVNPKPASGGVVTREAVYVPDQDAIVAYGPDRRIKNDPHWTRIYLCAKNRWVTPNWKTPIYNMHETAIEYDPLHNVIVLLWPPRFERDIRPHLLRLDVKQFNTAKE